MKRFHLFETGDLHWVPQFFHDAESDFLRFMMKTFRLYSRTYPLVTTVLEKTNTNIIVDLCSGAGDPIEQLAEYFKSSAKSGDITIYISDLYPNLAAFADIEHNYPQQIKPILIPVNALDVPVTLTGMRLMYSSFHHFAPADAQHMLQDAVNKSVPIGIFEVTDRSIVTIIKTIPLTVIATLIFLPFTRPFRWRKIFFTYIIPIMPLLILWNGTVSGLRSYTPSEIGTMIANINSADYKWQVCEHFSPCRLAKITCVIGYP